MIAGVDVGQKRDYTAVCLVDKTGTVRGVHRLRLGQDWRAILAGVEELVRDCTTVVVDATGVGSVFTEALAERVPGRVLPFTFTRQSKLELVGTLAQVIGERKIRVAPTAPGADVLREELRRFVASPTRTGWAFTGKQGGGHDDVVMALALAVRGALIR